jgi:hypothetical protein
MARFTLPHAWPRDMHDTRERTRERELLPPRPSGGPWPLRDTPRSPWVRRAEARMLPVRAEWRP